MNIDEMSLDQKREYLRSVFDHDGYKVWKDLGEKYVRSLKLKCDEVADDKFLQYKYRVIGLEEMLGYAEHVLKNWDKKTTPVDPESRTY